MDCLAWLMTHSFGISLVYPGSTSLMGLVLERPLLDGRTKLVMDHSGERSKIVTWDNNEIDTMFVDMRKKYTLNRNFARCLCFYSGTPRKARPW